MDGKGFKAKMQKGTLTSVCALYLGSQSNHFLEAASACIRDSGRFGILDIDPLRNLECRVHKVSFAPSYGTLPLS